MKLKTTVSSGTPTDFVRAVNDLRQTMMAEVIGPILRSPEFGPAEFFVQGSDFTDPSGGYHCNPELSRVSRNANRAENDFKRALERMIEIYTQLIRIHFKKGARVQLFIVLMLDSQPSLLESEPLWIEGEADRQSKPYLVPKAPTF